MSSRAGAEINEGGLILVGRGNRKLHLRRKYKDRGRPWEDQLARLGEFGDGPQRLWAAVLEQALCEVRGDRAPTKGMGRWGSGEAREWFASRERDYLGSFESICSELELPAREIRRYVLG